MTLKNPTEFPAGETHFFIDGAVGDLEVLTLAANHPRGVAVICHPHPLHLGTMHNKVVHTLSRAFHHQHCHTVRFNYRGVGKSAGQFADSIGEVDDLLAVLAWVNRVLMAPKVWLAGFSFGAYIAAMGAYQHSCQQLFSVAPAVTNQPYAALKPMTCPWIVIQGEQDEVIEPSAVYAWVKERQRIDPQIRLITMPTASHFFHGQLIELRNLVEENFAISL